MKNRARAYGFTLLELMVALVVVSILLTVGLPSFSASVRQNCTITAANTLLTVLTAARSEALKRDRNVGICKSTDGVACATGSAVTWDRGYLMYVDLDGDGERDAAESVLRTEVPLTTCASITTTSHFANRMYYGGLGKPNIGGSFTAVANDSAAIRRRVVISPTGRPRVCNPDQAVSSDGTPCGSTP
ncbi:GspH/FimT family pseudopilin [Nevskia sp.]|uniref:GspH/FimT family pseudopilin n=1 Tax=Nevskia sp. TaxID=1929292 RepID=UPI0025DA7429|nr:GspH/FimT family pseudopilin [Nevskia sp.]